MSTVRTRHKLIGRKRKTQPKNQSKKRKRKDGTNSDVLGMTDVFLQGEGKKQGLDHDDLINSTFESPVPNDEELDAFLETFNFDPNEKLPESKGGRRRRKSKRKTRKKRKKRKRKRKTRRRR